jgi:hypothetical protein
MNAFEERLATMRKTRGLDPITAMNLLQNQGIISDNCIGPGDVPDSEAVKAIEFLRAWVKPGGPAENMNRRASR